jgi:general secretion pathway protein A
MYESFYGLRERTFNLTPDPQFLFLNQRCRDAITHILYGIERREGFALIAGDVGTGKTTLCWGLLERLEGKKVSTALVQNPLVSDTDMLRSILQDLGVRPAGAHEGTDDTKESAVDPFDSSWLRGLDRKDLLDRLNAFLAQRAQEDIFTVLIIDESQNLSLEMLEQLRLLSNLETTKRKFLQIIFVGQLELVQKLELPALRQLNQRISIRFETKTLSRDDTEKYVRHRLAVAGGRSKVRFGSGTLNAIHKYSKGYPRLINLICDRALLAGYSERSYTITRKMVKSAVTSLRGTEEVGGGWTLSWMRKALPVLAAVVLLGGLFLILARLGLIPIRASSVVSPVLPVTSIHQPAG